MTGKVQPLRAGDIELDSIDSTHTWCEAYIQGHNWVIECNGVMLNGISLTKRSYMGHTAYESSVNFERERLLKQIENIVLAANYVHKEDAQGLMQHVLDGEPMQLYTKSLQHRLEKIVIPELKQRILDREISVSAMYNQIKRALLDAIREDQYARSGGLNKLSPAGDR